MFDDIPIVPNLYEAPSNPQAKDCYYNITLDKYYIYDGSQWLEAKLEGNASEDQDTFELKYSMDGGETFTTEIYTNFDELRTALNSPPINNAFYIGITLFSNPAILIPRTDNVSLTGVALLKLQNTTNPKPVDIFKLKYSKDNGTTYVTEVYWDFSILEDRMNSSVLNGVTNIEVSMLEGNDPYGDENEKLNKDIFYLSYSRDGGQTFITEQYDNYDVLINRINAPEMTAVTDIKFSMGTDSAFEIDDGIVGKIYPKIIFNQKLVENLIMNTKEMNQSIFDNTLVFYKDDSSRQYTYRVSLKLPEENEWITRDFSSIAELNQVLSSEYNYSNNTINYPEEIKIEQIGG